MSQPEPIRDGFAGDSRLPVPETPNILIRAMCACHMWLQRLAADRKGVMVLVTLAVLAKIVVLMVLEAKPPNEDGIRYLRAAQEMAAGNLDLSLAIYRMPAYPFLIWMVHVPVPDWILAARLLSVLGLLGSTWVLYRMTHLLFGQAAAFWACLAFLVSPMQNEMTVLIYRGPLYLFFFALAVWLMMRAVESPRPGRIFVAAGLGFVASLFRIEGLFLTPLFLLAMVFLALRRPAARKPVALGVGGCALVAILMGMVFWAAGGIESVGLARFDEAWQRLSLLIQGEGFSSYARIKAGLNVIEASSGIPSQEGNFGEIALRFFWLIYLLGLLQLLFTVLHGAFLVPLAAGLRGEWRRPALWLALVFLVYCTMLYVVMVMNDYSGGRFVFAASFLLYPLVGRGAERFAVWIGARVKKKRFRWWIAFYIVMLVMPIWGSMGKMETEDESSVAAGRWFASSAYRHEAILGNDPRIAYAAGIPLYGKTDQYLHFRPEDRDYSRIEEVALTKNRPLIFLKLRKTKLERMPSFTRYHEIRRFSDEKKIVFVFARSDEAPRPQ